MARTRRKPTDGPYFELTGGRRLHYLVVDQVRRLLARTTFSRRDIARLAGCSRDSVQLIADGQVSVAASHQVYLEEGEEFVEKASRCSEGHLCYIFPCRTCKAEHYKRAGRAAEAVTIGRPKLREQLIKLQQRAQRNGDHKQ